MSNWLSCLGNKCKISTIKVFLNPFAKGLAILLQNTVCDGIINLQINKITCDFCQIFCLINVLILYGLPKIQIQMYIYCIHWFMSLFIIELQSIIGNFFPNLWQRCLEKPLIIVEFKWPPKSARFCLILHDSGRACLIW